MTSSKLNGWSESGFAFGIQPPWAGLAARSSDHTSCWHALPLACSAFCYHVAKDVWILAVIVPVAELGQVQRQVVFAHLVIGADHTPLQQAPEAVQVRGMHIAAHILTAIMAHRLMRIAQLGQALITRVLISGHQGHVLSYSLPYKALQSLCIDFLNDLGHDLTLASHRANNGNLALGAAMGTIQALRDMLVLKLAADVGFVYLYFAHQRIESAVLHGRSDAMAHIPSGPIGPATDHALYLQGANPLLAGHHEVDDLKPSPQRIVRVLEDRMGDDREAVAVPSSALLALTDPMERTALDGEDLGIVATGAVDPIRPAALKQELLAGGFVFESIHHAGERRFHCLASVMLRPFYSFMDVVSSGA